MNEKETYQNSNIDKEHLSDSELAQYAEYLRNETDRVPDRLADHVESCSFCRSELMSITDMLDLLPDVLPDTVQEAGPSPYRMVYKVLRTAAAVAAVMLLAWGIRYLAPDHSVNEPVATNTVGNSGTQPAGDSKTLPAADASATVAPAGSISMADTLLYAEAYVENSTFESLVEARYRAGGDPKVSGPHPASVFASGDTLKLFWNANPGDDYSVLILDNKAKLIKELKTGDQSPLAWKLDLKPGLYYWKFLSKDDLWKVGKIRIINKVN